ncbi:subtilisin family serine protease [Actinokineospora baliensis]|uniref:S8 family serine peptidase n=1 Tax=Actinokineospora baliensis TaxID=547056 RepID=UPI00195950AD|nr:S8 family serine peptidase [Actinokineospora baliensis]MBM7776080.1 subtilisin family serine protease [Actinokineospora baliensis]
MPASRPRTGVVAAAVLAAAAIATGPVTEARAQAAPAQDQPAQSSRGEITLITGDHVVFAGGQASIRPARGRERVTFLRRVDQRGDLSVYPDDVLPDLAAGRLDRRLFNVSALVRDGFGDQASKATPLIVTYDGAAPRLAAAADVRALTSVNGASFTVAKGTPFLGGGTRAAGLARVWLDGRVTASLDRSVPQIGAPEAWKAGLTGKGVTVAVLDTGIDATHPDLAGAVTQARNFSDSPDTDDRVGHGTHVAATITGSGRYQGVAPDSALLVGKVLGDHGGGSESDVIAGMEWAATSGADVVNLSLGTSSPSTGDDPASLAVNRLTAETGTLFVVAAGNTGRQVGSPAAADAALTVGAVDRADALAPFSSRGPRAGDGAIKPDITAPGVAIVAAKAAHGEIGDPVGDRHVSLSGTSMATPHVAGAAALLVGQHPDWRPERLKAALVGSAKPNPALTPFEQGGGRVDVARVIAQEVTADSASLSLGVARWPHHDDAVITRTLTYRNSGTSPVTLDLTADVRGPATPPAGFLTFSPSRVQVPAGGQASVTVTADTTFSGPDGRYSGAITATGGSTVVRTPFGVDKEEESYDLTVEFKDLPGNASRRFVFLVDLDRSESTVDLDSPAKKVFRLRKGNYFFEGSTFGDADVFSWEPRVAVTKDATLVVDGTKAVRPAVSIAHKDAKVAGVELDLRVAIKDGHAGAGISAPDFEPILLVPSKTSAPRGVATFSLRARLAKPDETGAFTTSPYFYAVGFEHDGAVPAKLNRHFADKDLVVVRTEAAAGSPGAVGWFDDLVSRPLPAKFDRHYSPGLEWFDVFSEGATQFEYDSFMFTEKPVVYEKGKPAVQRWNNAVFGPALPTSDFLGAVRLGDELEVSVPLYGDQDPNHTGLSDTATASTELYRDAELVAKFDRSGSLFAVVPPGKQTYRLRASDTRQAPFTLSTAVTAEWTFASERTPDDKYTHVRLPVVRFAPPLDGENKAKAGSLFVLPLYGQRSGGDSAGISTPVLRVSYDDGATWRTTPVIANGGKWFALLHHPAGAKFVSLKASAKAADGATVEQTVIRAYGLK